MIPLLVDPTANELHFSLRLLPLGFQSGQVGSQLSYGLVVRPPGPIFGVGQHALGLLLRTGQKPGRLLAGFGDGEIGRSLCEDQGSPQGFVVPAVLVGVCGRFARCRFRSLGAFNRLAETIVEHLEGDGNLLQELVDVLLVVAAHLLAKFDFAKRLGGNLHAAMLVGRLGAIAEPTAGRHRRAVQWPRASGPER